jgi:hypothetical protein
MSRDLLAEFLPWTPLGSHAVTCCLRDHDLPHDVHRLAHAIYGRAGPFGVEYGSIELVRRGSCPARWRRTF